MPLIKVATGSLGQGLSAGAGMALAKKLDHAPGRVFVLQGDGETAEGSVWEAADAAAGGRLDNLVVIVDANRLGQSGPTRHGHDLAAYERKFRAFGWATAVVAGHDVRGTAGSPGRSPSRGTGRWRSSPGRSRARAFRSWRTRRAGTARP